MVFDHAERLLSGRETGALLEAACGPIDLPDALDAASRRMAHSLLARAHEYHAAPRGETGSRCG